MKARILLLAAGIATLTSCTSLYKTGQTPDDVYYSPARPALVTGDDEYVQNDGGSGYQSYQEYQDAYRDDRFLRLSIGNPYYLSEYTNYEGFDWRYNAYTYYDGSPWNNYFLWNNYYNPYSYCVVPVGGFSHLNYIKPVSRPIAFNGASYHSASSSLIRLGSNGNYYSTPAQQGSRYNNSNSYTPAGSNNSNNNYRNSNNNTYTPTRSYTPSSSPSSSGSSGGGGGGGGGGVSRPTRP
jgi:hypothetical protein